MKKSLLISLVLFFLLNVVLLVLLYWFLDARGFDAIGFAAASGVFLLTSLVAGYIIVSDILEHKQRQDDRLNHMTREVLHEINIPIATIEANISMIEKSLESPKDYKRVARIKSASVRLKRLYKELSYGINKEILAVARESFDLGRLVSERVDIYGAFGRNRFVVDVDDCEIKGDKIGLEQTVDNILGNAVKYSMPNEVIEVRLKNRELTIRDSGKGMDANEILHIYERYYQGDNQVQGEGIGLTLVKRYCDEEGIGIRITSEVDKGTTVVLSF